MSIENMKKEKDYRRLAFDILTNNRYGIGTEGVGLVFGLEDVAEELEVNAEQEVDNTEEANVDANADLAILDQDESAEEDDTVVEPGDPDVETPVKPEVALNIMNVMSDLTNKYALLLEEFNSNNPKLLEYTGSLKESDMYESFVKPAMDLLTSVYKREEFVNKDLQKFVSIVSDKRVMSSITGQPNCPFIYEGLQIVLYDVLRNLLGMVPYSIKFDKGLVEIIEIMAIKPLNALIQMVKDINELSSKFGSKIYFIAPVISEITGKSTEISSTPYANLPAVQTTAMTGMRLANESIMNLVEIKNNNSLAEYALIMKMLVAITTMTKKTVLKSACTTALSTVIGIINTTNPEVVDEAIAYFRQSMIVPEMTALAELPEDNVADLVQGTPAAMPDKETSLKDDLLSNSPEVVEPVEPEDDYDFDNQL